MFLYCTFRLIFAEPNKIHCHHSIKGEFLFHQIEGKVTWCFMTVLVRLTLIFVSQLIYNNFLINERALECKRIIFTTQQPNIP